MSDQYLTPKQVAGRWQVSDREVRRLCATGALSHMRVGRAIRISERAVLDYQRARTVRGRSPV